ncbi:hypothetical protein GCG54_00015267 [Colletotrichum gloeosporioides]|uniref:Uncharacterized protein n=1 Tax=Colletotrichum gloeosporioides TaxID=474922 RepID=A0A8H4FDD3_COLGL|nr:uncharacterized protein GCG54_00015267 [Colletotrichum gloeosporioides]KAF3798287.1 hypothetical protein GCG54_00015267 [Colletotrichum gloeosporioides]
MIIERDSAVLGYPGEIFSPLNAVHHTICKHPSQQDANYINVQNVISSFLFHNNLPQELQLDLIQTQIHHLGKRFIQQSFCPPLNSLQGLRIPIRVVLISRPFSAARLFEKLKTTFSDSFHQVAMKLPNSAQQLYIKQEFESSYMWESTFTSDVKNTLLSKCNRNLLQLRLVVDRLLLCNTEDKFDRGLNEAPSDLTDLYVRIAKSITEGLKEPEYTWREQFCHRLRALSASYL